MSPLPLIKLGTLLIKQLSKPLANGIKVSVKNHPSVSKMIALPAQTFHKMEQRVRMSGFGWTKNVEVKPLSHKAAVSLGAEMVGEVVIFTIAAGCIYLEVLRGKRSDKRKENDQNDQLTCLQKQVHELSQETRNQTLEIFELNKRLTELDNCTSILKNNLKKS